MNDIRVQNRMSLFLKSSSIVFIHLIVIFYLFYFDPARYIYVITEDYGLECASFILWLTATVLFSLVLCNNLNKFFKPGFILLIIGSIFMAGEEISWGQRILNIHTPSMLKEINIQGEMNFHNLYHFDDIYFIIVGILLTIYIAAIPILVSYSKSCEQIFSKFGLYTVPLGITPFFLAAIVFFLYYLQNFTNLPLVIVKRDEIGEYFFSLSFAVFALYLYRTVHSKPFIRIPIPSLPVYLLIFTFLLTCAFSYFFPNEPAFRARLNRFSSDYPPHFGFSRQSELIFQYILEHPEYIEDETYYNYGKLLMEAGKHTAGVIILNNSLDFLSHAEKDKPHLAEVNFIKGKTYTLLDEREKSTKEFEKTISKLNRIIENNENRPKKTENLILLGKIYIEKNDIHNAKNTLLLAKKHSSMKSQERIIDSLIAYCDYCTYSVNSTSYD